MLKFFCLPPSGVVIPSVPNYPVLPYLLKKAFKINFTLYIQCLLRINLFRFGHLHILKYFLDERKCDVNMANHHGWTLLHTSCW